jgi:hypothetical protein
MSRGCSRAQARGPPPRVCGPPPGQLRGVGRIQRQVQQRRSKRLWKKEVSFPAASRMEEVRTARGHKRYKVLALHDDDGWLDREVIVREDSYFEREQ